MTTRYLNPLGWNVGCVFNAGVCGRRSGRRGAVQPPPWAAGVGRRAEAADLRRRPSSINMRAVPGGAQLPELEWRRPAAARLPCYSAHNLWQFITGGRCAGTSGARARQFNPGGAAPAGGLMARWAPPLTAAS